MRLAGKTVLVTGASKGIGRALALGCAREGAEAAAAEIRLLGRSALVLEANLARVPQIERMFDRARKQVAKIDVLINNAGLTGWSTLFETTVEKWDEVLNTNLRGTFFCSLAAARWMRESGRGGAIVNVSTNCAALAVNNLTAYATSKAGLHGLTRQLAIELAPHRIRVNTFAPGPINVERNLRDDPAYREVWGGVVPLGRTGEADEMIGPALFLASDESSYMTGQVFYVDGGWSVQGKVPLANVARAARKHR